MNGVLVQPLAAVPEVMPVVQAWFEAEWPAYYGAGGRGDAARDIAAYGQVGALPLGLVAFLNGEPCGFAALKSDPFPSHPHLAPWVGAACVVPSLRRIGIGAILLKALESEGLRLGHARFFCATATSASLLLRCGWRLLETVMHEGEPIGIYERVP